MSDVARDVLVNLLSAVLVFVVVWGALFVSRRRRLVDFFHVRGRGITLYSSTLHVSRGGSMDSRGVSRAFAGRAIPEEEAWVLADIERTLSTYAFGGLPILRHLRFVDVDYRTETSPASTVAVDRNRTLLTIGSPGYNTTSEFVEAEFNPLGHFHASNGGIVCRGGPTTTVMSGMLLRARHPATGQIAFYAAGPSEAATVAAARYLIDHWTVLAKRYPGTQSFLIVVEARRNGGSNLIFQTPEPTLSPWRRLMSAKLGR
jgi:hypothetical protein